MTIDEKIGVFNYIRSEHGLPIFDEGTTRALIFTAADRGHPLFVVNSKYGQGSYPGKGGELVNTLVLQRDARDIMATLNNMPTLSQESRDNIAFSLAQEERMQPHEIVSYIDSISPNTHGISAGANYIDDRYKNMVDKYFEKHGVPTRGPLYDHVLLGGQNGDYNPRDIDNALTNFKNRQPFIDTLEGRQSDFVKTFEDDLKMLNSSNKISIQRLSGDRSDFA